MKNSEHYNSTPVVDTGRGNRAPGPNPCAEALVSKAEASHGKRRGCNAALSRRTVEKQGLIYGYVRVNAKDQNEARQIDAMNAFGVDKMVVEKLSGKNFDRPAYQLLLKRLREGDTLVVKSIDRLGRNYDEILNQWRFITKKIGVAIVVLDMPLLDTRSNRDLTGTLIADIVLELLSYVAQTEREFIHQRQAEGIAAAKARGIRFGPPSKKRPENLGHFVELWSNGLISARKAALELHLAHTTFLKWAREMTGQSCLQQTGERAADVAR